MSLTPNSQFFKFYNFIKFSGIWSLLRKYLTHCKTRHELSFISRGWKAAQLSHICFRWGTFVLFCFVAFPNLNAPRMRHIWLSWAAFHPLEINESWCRDRSCSAMSVRDLGDIVWRKYLRPKPLATIPLGDDAGGLLRNTPGRMVHPPAAVQVSHLRFHVHDALLHVHVVGQ